LPAGPNGCGPKYGLYDEAGNLTNASLLDFFLPISRVRLKESAAKFVRDSPLEEAVKSEPVSEWGRNFLASWENTGNSSDSGLDDANSSAKRLDGSITYK
jgi:hypothetical protein